MKLDIGSSNYVRGDVGLDVNFGPSGTDHEPTHMDGLMGGRNPWADRVKADANYPLPFRDDCFDEVTICHTLEHLRRPYECLREAKRVLKRRGILKVLIPNAVKNEADWKDEGHLFSFTLPTIKRLIGLLFEVKEAREEFNRLDLYVEAYAP